MKPEDYPKLKASFDKWEGEEKEGLLFCLRALPEHQKILTDGEMEQIISALNLK